MTTFRKFLLIVATWLAFIAAPPVQADDLSGFAAKLLAGASPLGDRIMGKAEAPVVMVEYASATCPHCAAFHTEVLPTIKTEFIDTGKVKLIFREFPLDQSAMAVFMLLRCLPEDKYFPAMDQIFSTQKTWMEGNKPAEVYKIMEASGMTKPQFDACLKDVDKAKSIYESMQKAVTDFSIKGTPTVFVNGKIVEEQGSVEAVRAAITQALAKP